MTATDTDQVLTLAMPVLSFTLTQPVHMRQEYTSSDRSSSVQSARCTQIGSVSIGQSCKEDSSKNLGTSLDIIITYRFMQDL